MPYHESYGLLPASTLKLLKSKNVSPADFDLIMDLEPLSLSEVEDHIVRNSPNGYYNPGFPVTL